MVNIQVPSLPSGEVWIEMELYDGKNFGSESLPSGEVWIEISILFASVTELPVTSLRGSVD